MCLLSTVFKFLVGRLECYRNTNWFDFYFMNCLILSDTRFCFEFSFLFSNNAEVKIALESLEFV